jgi:hypothetical protein
VVALLVVAGGFWFWLQSKPRFHPLNFARVENFSGDVQVQSAGNRSVAANGQSLRAGEQLVTSHDGAVSVTLWNGTHLQVGPNSIARDNSTWIQI